MIKQRIRKGDVYELIVTGQCKQIKFIDEIKATIDWLTVVYANGRHQNYKISGTVFTGERITDALTQAIKLINRYIKNKEVN